MICIKSKENKFFNQVLKNQDVFSKIKLRKAKGDSSKKTLIIIYRKEYEKTKFNKDSVNVPLINPSIEKISMELELNDIFILIVLINSEKEMFLLKRLCPNVLIANVILEFKSKIILTIENEKFIKIPKYNNFYYKAKRVFYFMISNM